ncbi:SRPBCC domain-containing protein [Membranihabitans maritimus]|uniref:SRPBCC domain-containing protein n=1 Tax=Membranihabitans maritimus TaxID=2904244 RepID=UPI001F28C9DA|nr:SRPBCC domain-containing protein [Membranihabitans maritimus]
MERITVRLKIEIPSDKAFQKFVNELNEWWPKEYTWSQGELKEIKIDGRMNGLCTEIGPNGFRCDWGTVSEFIDSKKISLKWQISPKREPIPNPKKASDLQVSFVANGDSTIIDFEHFNFENHGEGSENYREMMNSEQGWDYILNNFKKHCEK